MWTVREEATMDVLKASPLLLCKAEETHENSSYNTGRFC
jgi:hypothetical protein